MDELTDILQCPTTARTLHWANESLLSAANGGPSYAVRDGIACFLPVKSPGMESADAGQTVADFYDADGWVEDGSGQFGDTLAFVDTRSTSLKFTNTCIARLRRYFRRGGKYLLDAGSGPIPHEGVLAYGDRFQRRVCVDLSVQALHFARKKLGNHGIYLQGDLTRLPLRSGSMDAVTCNHVIYQIPPELQAAAFLEIWRVLKPGGIAVIVYLWPPHGPLSWRLGRLAKVLFGSGVQASTPARVAADPSKELPHYPLSRSWFESQNWPFRHEFDTFRVVSNPFLKQHVPDDWRGGLFLSAIYALQVIAPRFCGRHGEVPAIVIRKPPSAR